MKKLAIIALLVVAFVLGGVLLPRLSELFRAKNSQELAIELLEITQSKDLFYQSMELGIESSMQKILEKDGYSEDFIEGLKARLSQGIRQEIMPWDEIKVEFAQIYTEELSRKELSGLIDFYKSDLGRKTIQKLPNITKKAMMWGNQKTNENIGEIEKLVQNYIADYIAKQNL